MRRTSNNAKSSGTPESRPARIRLIRVVLAYATIFSLFFWGVHGGVGHYWDWSFPYFSDQLGNLFSLKSSSWVAEKAGGPLGYSSDYFLRFFISLFRFLPPELVRYGQLVVVFTSGAFGVYLLARRHTRPILAFSLGLLAFVNPAIFYKYTAGHINYLVAFAVFVFFVYFLLHHFQKNTRSGVIIGLFLAAMGVQMQFFVIGAFFLLAFFAFNRHLFTWKYLAPVLIIPLLVHAVWLSNFATGAVSAAETGKTAAQISVKGAVSSDFLSVFTFSFSRATLLSKFYAFYELLWHAMLFVFLFWLLVRGGQGQGARARPPNAMASSAPTLVLLVFLALMIFMATGLYQALNLGPVTALYPMLREVGHFAPVIVLAALVLIAQLVRQSRWRWAFMGVLAGSLLIVGVKFQYYSQGYSFSEVRQKFAAFKAVADRDQSTYRILAYPFFGKYSFSHLPNDDDQLFPLKNTGHDSFATFAGQDFIKNAIAPHEFKESVQYQLLQSYDIDVLRPYNIKYIFDFSDIYESNYNRYVPATVYNNDLSLIKNDPGFFDKLLANNPGKLRRVNEHVLEVTNRLPRVHTEAEMFSLEDDSQAGAARSFTRRALNRPLDYVQKDALRPHTTTLEPLLRSARHTHIDQASGTFSQRVPAGSELYSNTSYSMLLYQLEDDLLTLYTDSPGSLLLDGQTLQTATSARRQIAQTQVHPQEDYYVAFKGQTVPLVRGETQRMGVGSEGDTVELLTAKTENLVRNSSFEQTAWEEKVGDCNNYDSNGALAMQRTAQTASDGSTSLELNATRHNACTSTPVALEASKQYLLSFDYQSPNAQTANFFLSYGSDSTRFAKGFRAITDSRWHSASQIITTPEQADQNGQARLFLYALEQDGKQTAINRYDNVRLLQVETVQRSVLPAPQNPYQRIAATTTAQTLTFKEESYTYQNLVANPSFERGPWQAEVGDCNKYDSRPDISMRIVDNASDGERALELSAQRHDACIRTTTNINEDASYLLNFDYQTKQNGRYGYALSFDDPQATVSREQFTAKNDGWQRASFTVRTPQRAATLTLYLYAFEEDGRGGIVRYDNVQLVPLPDFNDRFYAVQPPNQTLQPPRKLHFSGSRPFRKNITITGASTRFFLTLSETYNSKWRLRLASPQVDGLPGRWLPGSAEEAMEPFETSGYMNGWLVDPTHLCADKTASCTKQSDGTYNMRLVAEFAPQRWFGLAATVSWTTVVGCIVYLALTGGKAAPTYQLFVNRFDQRRRTKQ